MQTAEEIENILNTWIEGAPTLAVYFHDGEVQAGNWVTINSFTDLVWYLEDEAWRPSMDEPRQLTVPGIEHPLTLAETKGGEGEGNYAHAVLSIGERHFMLHGYHRSYDGTYFDSGFSEVKKVQKVVDAWDEV